MNTFYFATIIFSSFLRSGDSHGMLQEPPARSTLYHTDPTAPINVDDNGLNCGGKAVQWDVNNGRCGECGDDYSLPRPRPNDEGGFYAKDFKVPRTYVSGQAIPLTVKLTANHMGYFEFKLCSRPTFLTLTTQACLDSTILTITNGQGTRFYLPSTESIQFYPQVKLPDGFTCDYCTLQWTYTGGNNWGLCSDGTGRLGCGPQETFVNCADIRITGNGATTTTTTKAPATTTKATATTTKATATTTKATATTTKAQITTAKVTTKTPGVFVCPGNGVYPDPTTCTKFYNCANGIAYTTPCPSGLYFNPTVKVCDWAYNVPSCTGR